MTERQYLAYVAWYSRMLDETAPDGIVYAYADYPVPEDYLPVHNKPGMKIQYPPSASIIHPQGDRDGYLPSSQKS